MAKKVTVILTGSDAINRKLAMLTTQQAKEAIRKAARPALQPTLALARSLAPKNKGRLARSIKIRSIRRSRKGVGMRVTTSKWDNQFTGKTFYGAFQEWGWKTGARKNALDRTSRRIARQLRSESRKAGGLARRGTDFRYRQEAYFTREGGRRALLTRQTARRKIDGRRYLKNAAIRTRSQVLKLYRDGIVEYIRKVWKG